MKPLDLRRAGIPNYQSLKIANALYSLGIPFRRKAIKAAILEGKISPHKTRNYGMQCHKSLCAMVGIDCEPFKSKKWQVKCPHCQEIFDLAGNRYPLLRG